MERFPDDVFRLSDGTSIRLYRGRAVVNYINVAVNEPTAKLLILDMVSKYVRQFMFWSSDNDQRIMLLPGNDSLYLDDETEQETEIGLSSAPNQNWAMLAEGGRYAVTLGFFLLPDGDYLDNFPVPDK